MDGSPEKGGEGFAGPSGKVTPLVPLTGELDIAANSRRPVNGVSEGVIDTATAAAAGTVAEKQMSPVRFTFVNGRYAFAASNALHVVHV